MGGNSRIQISPIFVADCNNFSKKYLSNTAKYQLLKKTPTLKNSLIVSIVQGFLLKNSNEKTQSENWKCSEAIWNARKWGLWWSSPPQAPKKLGVFRYFGTKIINNTPLVYDHLATRGVLLIKIQLIQSKKTFWYC